MGDIRPQPNRSALDWAAENGGAEFLVNELRARARRRRRRRTALATVTTLAVAGFLWLRPAGAPAPQAQSRPAVVRQPLQQNLPDGTVVDLRDAAELTVDFSGPQRRVILRHGEAHFAVAKDPGRPFVVTAGGVEVRAVGTEFSVQIGASSVAVLVTEGRVALERDSAAPKAEPLAVLDAGTQAVIGDAVSRTPLISALASAEIDERLAWRVRRLEFSGTRLSEAVELFNRYSPTRLILGDARLGSLQVSGIVRANNPAALLELLEANYDIVARPVGPAEVRLERRH
jgi:transmembrane sensor